ncbi:MAG: hypothetical protein L0211_12265 [Planctomycetaceae bacterium]|nr:hypothetical protein [Planctomycetaceae bacterium]
MVSATIDTTGREAISPAELLRQRALTPSERDFQVFEAVAFGGASTREAASEFGISQTRVMQVRRHVAQWIATSVPEGLDLTPIQRLRLAAHIAEGRVDHLYSKALEAWRASQKPLPRECRGRSEGDPRYLMAAARICMRQLELAGTIRKVFADAEDGSKFNVQGSRLEADASPTPQAGEPTLTTGQRPLDRDCSADASSPAEIDRQASGELAASDCEDEGCDEIEDRRRAFLAALENDSSPVHPPFFLRTRGGCCSMPRSRRRAGWRR